MTPIAVEKLLSSFSAPEGQVKRSITAAVGIMIVLCNASPSRASVTLTTGNWLQNPTVHSPGDLWGSASIDGYVNDFGSEASSRSEVVTEVRLAAHPEPQATRGISMAATGIR